MEISQKQFDRLLKKEDLQNFPKGLMTKKDFYEAMGEIMERLDRIIKMIDRMEKKNQ